VDHGGEAMENVQKGIYEIIIKTMCLAQPMINHLVNSCQSEDIENSLCFQILGFDIMLDHNLQPFLLEVNQMPSLATDSPLDYRIKKGMVVDVMKKLSLNVRRKF